VRNGSHDDHDELVMDIETMIGRSRRLSLHTALRGADQLIRWAKFTMNPSGPRTDAMRQMPSY